MIFRGNNNWSEKIVNYSIGEEKVLSDGKYRRRMTKIVDGYYMITVTEILTLYNRDIENISLENTICTRRTTEADDE